MYTIRLKINASHATVLTPQKKTAFFLTTAGSALDRGAAGASHIDSLQLAGAVIGDDVELQRLALGQRAEALGVDHALVAEEVLAAKFVLGTELIFKCSSTRS